jgi:hypothetical protein
LEACAAAAGGGIVIVIVNIVGRRACDAED